MKRKEMDREKLIKNNSFLGNVKNRNFDNLLSC